MVSVDRRGRPQSRLSSAAVRRVLPLVRQARVAGLGVAVSESDGRWHLWLEGCADGVSVLPLLRSVGAGAPASFGVLDLRTPAGTSRWVVHAGSVGLLGGVPARS